MDFANVIKYDINKNSSKRAKGDGDLEAILEEYSWYVQIIAIPFLRELFKQGLYKQKINFRTVADYSGVFDPPIPVTISPTLYAVEFDAIKL